MCSKLEVPLLSLLLFLLTLPVHRSMLSSQLLRWYQSTQQIKVTWHPNKINDIHKKKVYCSACGLVFKLGTD